MSAMRLSPLKRLFSDLKSFLAGGSAATPKKSTLYTKPRIALGCRLIAGKTLREKSK
jgi:hypothetical protein